VEPGRGRFCPQLLCGGSRPIWRLLKSCISNRISHQGTFLNPVSSLSPTRSVHFAYPDDLFVFTLKFRRFMKFGTHLPNIWVSKSSRGGQKFPFSLSFVPRKGPRPRLRFALPVHLTPPNFIPSFRRMN
jgi:hypothetical protein